MMQIGTAASDARTMRIFGGKFVFPEMNLFRNPDREFFLKCPYHGTQKTGQIGQTCRCGAGASISAFVESGQNNLISRRQN